jgi:hypothetical protein
MSPDFHKEIASLWQAIQRIKSNRDSLARKSTMPKMPKLSPADLSAGGSTAVDRKTAEQAAQNAIKIDGRKKRNLGERMQVIFRMTPEKKRQLDRLAEVRGRSYSETMSDALDALDEKYRGNPSI